MKRAVAVCVALLGCGGTSTGASAVDAADPASGGDTATADGAAEDTAGGSGAAEDTSGDVGPSDLSDGDADAPDDAATPDDAGSPDAAPDAPDTVAPDTGAPEGPLTPEQRCERIKASVAAGNFGDAVAVTCDATTAWIASDTYPAHDKMNGIVGTNEQVPVPAPGFAAPIPLAPVLTDAYGTRDNALGVAVNGVPIYDYTSQGELDPTAPYDAKADTLVQGQLDVCNGHAGRGDDYHYHASPTCLLTALEAAGAGANPILGWAYDGYPIYGDANPDGSPVADGALDVCNGQPDPLFGFRYHTSPAPPYILQCLRGAFDPDALPRVKPMDAAAGGGKPPGQPPQGGVEDLLFVEHEDGLREMTYRHGGQDYFIRYSPAAKAGCWHFVMNTVSQGAVEGDYCRAP